MDLFSAAAVPAAFQGTCIALNQAVKSKPVLVKNSGVQQTAKLCNQFWPRLDIPTTYIKKDVKAAKKALRNAQRDRIIRLIMIVVVFMSFCVTVWRELHVYRDLSCRPGPQGALLQDSPSTLITLSPIVSIIYNSFIIWLIFSGYMKVLNNTQMIIYVILPALILIWREQKLRKVLTNGALKDSTYVYGGYWGAFILYQLYVFRS